MAVERTGVEGVWDAQCDACPYAEEIDALSFPDTIAAIKRIGWRIVKTPAGWFHLCPACIEDGKHERI